MFWKKNCAFCKKPIEGDMGVRAEVEVFGRVGTWKRDFCSDDCLDRYKKNTAELMKTRRPNVCMKCLR